MDKINALRLFDKWFTAKTYWNLPDFFLISMKAFSLPLIFHPNFKNYNKSMLEKCKNGTIFVQVKCMQNNKMCFFFKTKFLYKVGEVFAREFQLIST